MPPAEPDVPPVPAGFSVAFDAGNTNLGGATLFGGSPPTAMRLTAAGQEAMAELASGPVRSVAAGRLARRLTDAGLAHPRPPEAVCPIDATVVIPVRDRPAMLDRCLGSLGRSFRVVVVDDASRDQASIARVAREHGAELICRAENGGPAAARNTGIAAVDTDLLVLIDSDCVPPPAWIENLAAHLADPVVGAVAPRVVPLAPTGRSTVSRYGRACSSLDLGDREALVAPLTRVSYVPAAALVLRLSAVVDVADGPNVFDPALRFGEDVDLVWRLHEAGWRIRYEPGVQVGHDEPDSWSGLLARRFRYGTSAAPLALRHREAMAPIVLRPLPALAVLGLLAGRGDVGAGAYVSSVVTARRSLQSAGLPTSQVPARMLVAVHQTWLAAGRYCTWFAAPVLFGALLAPRRSRRTLGLRRRGRRLAAASLLLGPPLTAWASRRPDLDPPRFVLGHIADDIAYGIGVLVGCRRSRTLIPVRPVVLRHGPNQAAPRTV